MYYFRPNFWEATSHIKRVQPTSTRVSTSTLNLSDLIPILRVLCFLLLFRSETTSPLKEWTSSHRDSTSTLGLGGLIPQRLWPPSPRRCPRAHTIWGHTSKVHSGDFLIQAITLTPVFGLWYTRHWNFVLQILCESSLVQNTIMSIYSSYKIVVTHIPSCVLNWKIEKHMSSCGHRHKTTKVKHVRDTHHHHLTRFNTWGGKNVFVCMKLLLRVEQLNHPFLSLCFREKLFVDERKDAICWSWSQPALVCSKSTSPTNKTPNKSTGPKKKHQTSQMVPQTKPQNSQPVSKKSQTSQPVSHKRNSKQ